MDKLARALHTQYCTGSPKIDDCARCSSDAAVTRQVPENGRGACYNSTVAHARKYSYK